MTAITATPVTSPDPGVFGRTWRIVRLLTANPATTLLWPLSILTAIFVMTWSIWWILAASLPPSDAVEVSEGTQYNGGVTFIFVYMLVTAVQAVNQTFPLALGFGSTRRAFTVGSATTFVLLAVFYSTVLLIGAALEDATAGWGLDGYFFRSFALATDAGWLAQWWIYFCWFVFFLFTGTIFAAVFVRWKAVGLTTMFIVLGVLLVGVIALFTYTATWHLLWQAIGDLGALGVASVMLIPGVVSAFIGHLLLRRATPRN